MKEIVTHSENEGQKTKQYHVACEPKEQLKKKAEFSKAQISTPDLPNRQRVKLPKLMIKKCNGALENCQPSPNIFYHLYNIYACNRLGAFTLAIFWYILYSVL